MEKNCEDEIEPTLVDENTDTEDKEFKANILAQFNDYSNRPDLMLKVIEEHDPGFIKAMSEEIKLVERQDGEARYKFGKRQAYAGLFAQVTSGVCCLIAMIYLIYTKQFGFSSIVGLSVFYAISQGGVTGFKRVIDALAKVITKGKTE